MLALENIDGVDCNGQYWQRKQEIFMKLRSFVLLAFLFQLLSPLLFAIETNPGLLNDKEIVLPQPE